MTGTNCAHRGTAYLQLNQYEKAVADFSRAIELQALLPQSYHNRSIALRMIAEKD